GDFRVAGRRRQPSLALHHGGDGSQERAPRLPRQGLLASQGTAQWPGHGPGSFPCRRPQLERAVLPQRVRLRQNDGCVSLFLCRDGNIGGSGMPARYSFSLLGQDGEPVASGTGLRPTRGFNTVPYGYRCFM
ncbi:unnamed protein product, partial [Urochloa humidicola]